MSSSASAAVNVFHVVAITFSSTARDKVAPSATMVEDVRSGGAEVDGLDSPEVEIIVFGWPSRLVIAKPAVASPAASSPQATYPARRPKWMPRPLTGQ